MHHHSPKQGQHGARIRRTSSGISAARTKRASGGGNRNGILKTVTKNGSAVSFDNLRRPPFRQAILLHRNNETFKPRRNHGGALNQFLARVKFRSVSHWINFRQFSVSLRHAGQRMSAP
jgi:hypothetical protein